MLQTPDDYRRLTRAVLEQSASHGVIYSETFLSPDFCGGGDVGAWREYLAAIEEGAAEAERVVRHHAARHRHRDPPFRAGQGAGVGPICAAETHGAFLRGFGLAGAELVGRPGDFAWSFDAAREAGLHLTAHAGEWGGPDMVADTIRDLRPERIGHGINAAKDPALVEQIAEHGIVLEVCPGSNVFLGAVPSWRDHPIADLMAKGVKVTVSTDDPPFFHTTMTREYETLASVFDLGEAEFETLARTALDAAFCDADTKARIAKRLETA